MHPYYQQPRPPPQPQPQPLQSRGFQPPPKPQQHPQPPYPSPPVSGFAQHPGYQGAQFQQQQQKPYYAQQQRYANAPQQRYTPQPHPVPAPAPVHQQPRPAPVNPQPHPAPGPYHPQGHAQRYPYVPAPASSYSTPPRANSQSPDKTRRPLPNPAAAVGGVRARPTSMPPQVRAPQHVQSPGPRAAGPSSLATQPFTPQPFAQTQPYQPQSHPQQQPSTPPQQPHAPIPHAHPLHSSPLKRIPSPAPTTSASASASASTSKRPLPAPPGGGACTSPPVAPPSTSPATSPAASQPISAPVPTPPTRRTLPFSPTQPPSVAAASARASTLGSPPKRSSTLPSPPAPYPSPSSTKGSAAKDASEQGEKQAPDHIVHPQSTVRPSFRREAPSPSSFARPSPAPAPTSFSRAAPSPSSFSRPPQKQPTQSLAFRLAALSLQEEQTHKPRAQAQFRPTSRAPDLDDAPPVRRSSFESRVVPTINLPGNNEDEGEEYSDDDSDEDDEDADTRRGPSITVSVAPAITVSAPAINVSGAPSISVSGAPSINVSEPEPPSISISEPEPPSISISEPPYNSSSPPAPSITFSDAPPTPVPTTAVSLPTSSSIPDIILADLEGTSSGQPNTRNGMGRWLICYGCSRGIVGRIVSAMGGRWHPECFKCTVCSELLELVSCYEHKGRPYCHLDYHEKFAPQCYHCRTPIVDERFITLDDPALGKRTYHEQHFFCAECGDPFLAPRIPGSTSTSAENGLEVVAQEDDVGFTVYKGHPYCEACHVRLRYPKCKRCRKSIRDGMQAVEALGGKWCWACFLCAGCEKPFDDPAFFQRENKPYCEPCFSLIVRNEV